MKLGSILVYGMVSYLAFLTVYQNQDMAIWKMFAVFLRKWDFSAVDE